MTDFLGSAKRLRQMEYIYILSRVDRIKHLDLLKWSPISVGLIPPAFLFLNEDVSGGARLGLQLASSLFRTEYE